MKINNESYPSLDKSDVISDFKVEFDFTRRGINKISINSFTVFDEHNIDVTDKLSVNEYDKLMVELEDYVSDTDDWTSQDQQEADWSSHPDY